MELYLRSKEIPCILAIHMLTLTTHEFIDMGNQVTARERQTYHEHFLDLCYQLALNSERVKGEISVVGFWEDKGTSIDVRIYPPK